MIRAAGICLILIGAATAARAATPASDDIDDPKLARRLKTRTTLAAPAVAPEASTPVVAPGLAASAPPTLTPTPASTPNAGLAAPFDPRVSPSASASTTSAADVVASGAPATHIAAPAPRDAGRTPTIGIGYRRFSFVQVGATPSGSTTGSATSEPFDSLSLDFYPISRLVRFGLSTQYGWQSGQFGTGNGDYFIAQSLSLGMQSAGAVVTPFAEGFAGGGYMRRFQFDRTVPTAYWQLGIDAGASFFLGDVGYVSVALGYLHPVNGFVKETSFTSVYVDTWSLKLGIGL
jgi:hypothetical protein